VDLVAYLAASASGHAEGRSDRSPSQLEALRRLHVGNLEQADGRYREAMSGRGWLSTYQVECALGLGRFCAKDKLERLRARGLVSRRNRDGEASYNRRRGYDWKWNKQPEGEKDDEKT
jgi:hypothetical protein